MSKWNLFGQVYAVIYNSARRGSPMSLPAKALYSFVRIELSCQMF